MNREVEMKCEKCGQRAYLENVSVFAWKIIHECYRGFQIMHTNDMRGF